MAEIDQEAPWRAALAAETQARQTAEAAAREAIAQQAMYAGEMGNAILAQARAEATLTTVQAEREAERSRAAELAIQVEAATRERATFEERLSAAIRTAPPAPDMTEVTKKMGTIENLLAFLKGTPKPSTTPTDAPIAFDLDVERGEMGEIRRLHITEKR